MSAPDRPTVGDLDAPPAQDVLALSAACSRRILEREGIAMFVALHDARAGRHPAVADPVGQAEGQRLAALFDHYERGLSATGAPLPLTDPGVQAAAAPAGGAPDQDEAFDPTGAKALIEVLVVLSDHHLRARPDGTGMPA